jgi:glycosyltransferase involved in cell wall biosynthesis
MKVNILTTTKLDSSKSMKIYSSQLIKNLKGTNEFKINPISIKGRTLPFIKNVLSKDIFYLVYAKLKEEDINHITDHSYGALAYFLKPERTIVTCHDLNALEYPKQSSWLGRKRFLYNIKGMLRAKHIITVSESTKRTILKHFNYNGKIYVIYNGLDKRFKRINDINEINKIKNKYKLSKEYKYLLHVGHSKPCKNIESILRVLNKLKNYRLIKVGQFEKKQLILINRLRISNKIIQYQNLSIEELKEIYNIVNVFLFPSLYEGFGFPVAEAMACGCPVICSNTSSLPEVGGNASFYINPNSDKELMQAIKEVLNNPKLRRQMIEKGLKQAKKFSWEKTAKQVLEVYNKVAEE